MDPKQTWQAQNAALARLRDNPSLSFEELDQIIKDLGFENLGHLKDSDLRVGGPDAVRRALLSQVEKTGGIEGWMARNTQSLEAKRLEDRINEQMPSLDVTDEDRRLVEQSIGAAGDIARRQLEAQLPRLFDQASASAGAQGIIGGSADVANRALIGAEAQRSLADMLSRESIAGGQALLQLPLQRAGMQMDFNNALFNQFLQSATFEQSGRFHADELALQREQLRYQRQQARNQAIAGALGAGIKFIGG